MPITEFTWIYNADYDLPAPLPESVETRLVSAQLMKSVVELKNHLESVAGMNINQIK